MTLYRTSRLDVKSVRVLSLIKHFYYRITWLFHFLQTDNTIIDTNSNIFDKLAEQHFRRILSIWICPPFMQFLLDWNIGLVVFARVKRWPCFIYLDIIIHFYIVMELHQWLVNVLTSSVVDHEYKPRSGKTKDYKKVCVASPLSTQH